MAILNSIQRKAVNGRLVLALIYSVLSLGAITMIYPFLLMVSGSTKSEIDMQELDVLPRFLYDETALFQRFVEQRYSRMEVFNVATLAKDEQGNRLYSFSQVEAPAPNSKLVDLWNEFRNSLTPGPGDFALGHFAGTRTVAELQYRLQQEVRKKYPDIPYVDLVGATPVEDWGNRMYQPMNGAIGEVYADIRNGLPARYFYPVSLRGYFITYILPQFFAPTAEELARLNREWGSRYSSFQDVELPSKPPANGSQRDIWWAFVRGFVSGRYIEIGPDALSDYRKFIGERYETLDKYNESRDASIASWDEVSQPAVNRSVAEIRDIQDFVKSRSSPEGLSLRSLDFDWVEFLRNRFDFDIQKLNSAIGADFASFEAVPLPVLLSDYAILRSHKGAIIWELLSRNYKVAWSYVVSQGNGFRNTVIFCLLNIFAALIVNPLAAYALSRFRPSWGQYVLFILMATMAFPAEVTQIPSFLLLRDLGWLNTFAALVIPAAANGYSIFLLKGFFDSLPQELYEAAEIDGCGEIRAFIQITIPLSMPILAVVALAAFTAAYGAFMFALLVCQKESMWTLMVYIYQLQQLYAQPIVFAALIIAALPTLVVFIFCQKVIMRGIVVPVEK